MNIVKNQAPDKANKEELVKITANLTDMLMNIRMILRHGKHDKQWLNRVVTGWHGL